MTYNVSSEVYRQDLKMKGTKINTDDILLLWENKDEYIQYHVLRDKIKSLIKEKNQKITRGYNKDVTDRTIFRYLQSLVEAGKLEKKIEANHATYYKPIGPSYMKEISKHHVDAMEIPEAINFLTYFLDSLSGWDFLHRENFSMEEMEKAIEKAKNHALAIERAKKSWEDAAKELGFFANDI